MTKSKDNGYDKKGKSFISFWIATGDCPVGGRPRNDEHGYDSRQRQKGKRH
jgi:hypothetical protein